MSTIAELAEDRVVEGVYAVARKRRLRTKSGSPYLALELVDPSGRIEGRVWNDVDLLDAALRRGRRRSRARPRRALPQPTPARRPLDRGGARRRPGRASRRRCAATRTSSTASSSSSPPRSSHPGLKAMVGRFARRCRDPPPAARPAGRTRTATTTTPAACSSTRSAWRRSAASSASSIRGFAPISLLSAALLHDIGRTVELEPGPGFRQTAEGRLLGHVHLGARLIEERARGARRRGPRRAAARGRVPPRRARGAKTAEAVGPLSREPARRGRRHAAGRER